MAADMAAKTVHMLLEGNKKSKERGGGSGFFKLHPGRRVQLEGRMLKIYQHVKAWMRYLNPSSRTLELKSERYSWSKLSESSMKIDTTTTGQAVQVFIGIFQVRNGEIVNKAGEKFFYFGKSVTWEFFSEGGMLCGMLI
jgi:hypothetical protein